MTALYIADIKFVLVGRPKSRARQKTKPKEERHVFSLENIPITLDDDHKIAESRYDSTMRRLTKNRVKDYKMYNVQYFLTNVRFSSKIMVDLRA
jgi:hypothetical protein